MNFFGLIFVMFFEFVFLGSASIIVKILLPQLFTQFQSPKLTNFFLSFNESVT